MEFEYIKQSLTELIADWLDSTEVMIDQQIEGYSDPVPREQTELHIRMAEAAMREYEATVRPIINDQTRSDRMVKQKTSPASSSFAEETHNTNHPETQHDCTDIQAFFCLEQSEGKEKCKIQCPFCERC